MIIIKGDDINGLVVNDFVFPKTKPINVTEKMPKFMYRVVNDVLQPYPSFNKDLCIKCGRCVDNCPPKALEMGKEVYKMFLLSGTLSCNSHRN